MKQRPEVLAHPTPWPALPLAAWQDTYATLHRWLQIVGKIRLAQAPMLNHWWQVTLYVNAQGLTTSIMPYASLGFEISFDFIQHRLRVETNAGQVQTMTLRACSVADCYRELMDLLQSLGLEIKIWSSPVEIDDPIAFEQDQKHCAYDPEYAQRCWQILLQTERVLQRFRSGFLGKCSPVHFFWGSFDLAVTRFSGRPAPTHPGGVPHLADWVTRLAYSHEVSSCGFWPGGAVLPEPVFYAYAYPEPAGFKDFPVRPAAAYYHAGLREFVLPYAALQQSANPDTLLFEFAQSTYEACAISGRWDRAALETSTDK